MNKKNKFLSVFVWLILILNSLLAPILVKANNEINMWFANSLTKLIQITNRDFARNLNSQLSDFKQKIESLPIERQKNILDRLERNINLSLNSNINDKNKAILSYVKYYFRYNFSWLEAETQKSPLENIDNVELKKVEQEILNIQNNIFNSWVDFYESIMSELDDLLNVKQTWNMLFEISWNIDWMTDFDWKIALSNIEAINSWLDSKFSWNLNSVINYRDLLNENENISWVIKTYFDIIANEDIYILLKDFWIDLNTNQKEVENLISDAKKIIEDVFQNNRYAKIVDENSKEFNKILNSLTPELVIEQARKTIQKPMLEVDRKIWDKYILKPTRYACDKFFELEGLMWKINPFYRPSTCTDLAFNRFKKTFSDAWEFYMIMWNDENTLWFKINDKSNELKDSIIELKYDKNNINLIKIILTPSDEDYAWQWIWFEYMKNAHINLKIKIEDLFSHYDINFKSTLNNQNKITKANLDFDLNNTTNWSFKFENNLLNWKFSIDSELLNWELNVDNNVLDWSFNMIQYWYDFNTWEYKKTWDIIVKINGKASSNLKMENIGINVIWKNTNDEKFLEIDSKMLFNGDKTTFNNDFYFSNPFLWSYAWKVNLESESTRQKDLFNMEIWISWDFWEINWLLKSDFNKEYWNFEIKSPNNYIEIDEEYFYNLLMSTNTYSAQIKKARDSSRVSDLMSLRIWLEQVYQEKWYYPNYDEFKDRLSIYLYSIPQDMLDWEVISNCEFGYKYAVWPDDNWIENQRFRLSTCLEDKWNIESRAKNDWWIYGNRFEVGTWIWNNFWEWKFLRDL